MQNKNRFEQMMNNLNEVGIERCLEMIELFVQSEKYNKNTTTERIADLQQLDKPRNDQRRADQEIKNKEVEKLKMMYKRELKMIGEQISFHEQKDIIQAIDIIGKNEFSIMKLISSYNWGYIQGVRAERARRKGRAN